MKTQTVLSLVSIAAAAGHAAPAARELPKAAALECLTSILDCTEMAVPIGISATEIATTCEGEAPPICVTGVIGLLDSLLGLEQQTAGAVGACGGTSPQCTKGIQDVGANLQKITSALNGFKLECAEHPLKCLEKVKDILPAILDIPQSIKNASHDCESLAGLGTHVEAGRGRRRGPDNGRRRSDQERRRASEQRATQMKACWANTGGTCNVLGCKDWRGETSCHDYLCMCKTGYCSDREGACQKEDGVSTLVKENVLIRSVHDTKYVLYVDGCGDPQDNNQIDIEEGYLKVRQDFDGPESRFDIYQTAATKDGKRGYFLVSKAFPSCVATMGLVKACVNVNGDDNDENNCDNHIRGVNEPFEALWEGWKAGPWAAAMALEKDGSYKLRSLRWTGFYMGMSRVGWVVQNMIETFNSDRVRWTFDPPMDSLDVFNVSAQQEDIDFV